MPIVFVPRTGPPENQLCPMVLCEMCGGRIYQNRASLPARRATSTGDRDRHQLGQVRRTELGTQSCPARILPAVLCPSGCM